MTFLEISTFRMNLCSDCFRYVSPKCHSIKQNTVIKRYSYYMYMKVSPDLIFWLFYKQPDLTCLTFYCDVFEVIATSTAFKRVTCITNLCPFLYAFDACILFVKSYKHKGCVGIPNRWLSEKNVLDQFMTFQMTYVAVLEFHCQSG